MRLTKWALYLLRGVGAVASQVVLFIVVGLAILAVPYFTIFGGHGAKATLRYEITVTLDVDGRQVSGAGVQEISASARTPVDGIFAAGLRVKQVQGQAIAVEVPGKPALFFLMSRSGGGEGWPLALAKACKWNASSDADPDIRISAFRDFVGPCELDGQSLPLIVRMGDEKDVTTLHKVTLPETGGVDGDVKLVSIALNKTDKPITFDLQRRLPWLNDACTVGKTDIQIATEAKPSGRRWDSSPQAARPPRAALRPPLASARQGGRRSGCI